MTEQEAREIAASSVFRSDHLGLALGVLVAALDKRAEDIVATREPMPDSYACQRCGRKVSLDCVIPNHLWNQIEAETGHNLLCPWCLDTECDKRGWKVNAMLAFRGKAISAGSSGGLDEHWERHVEKLTGEAQEVKAQLAEAKATIGALRRELEKIASANFKPWSVRATDPGDGDADGYVYRIKSYAKKALSDPGVQAAAQEWERLQARDKEYEALLGEYGDPEDETLSQVVENLRKNDAQGWDEAGRAVERAERAEAKNERLKTGLDQIMIGGNHLASSLVHLLGPGGDTFPSYDTNNEEARKIISSPVMFDLWVCWKIIMRTRDTLRGDHD